MHIPSFLQIFPLYTKQGKLLLVIPKFIEFTSIFLKQTSIIMKLFKEILFAQFHTVSYVLCCMLSYRLKNGSLTQKACRLALLLIKTYSLSLFFIYVSISLFIHLSISLIQTRPHTNENTVTRKRCLCKKGEKN